MIAFARAERGQGLIIMVLGLVSLLAAVGLAVDGGMVLLERRRMQNAADAGALASTRELSAHLCDESPDEAATDALIWNQVVTYAERNGVQDPTNNVVAHYVVYDSGLEELTVAGTVGSGQIPNQTIGISATVGIARPTVFLTLLGLHEGAASAHATAVTAPSVVPPFWNSQDLPHGAGKGVLPIGLLYDTLLDENGDMAGIGEKKCIIDDEDWDDCVDSDSGEVVIVECLETRNLPSANRGWLMLSCVFNDGELPGGGVGPRIPDCSASNSVVKDWIDQDRPFVDPIYAAPPPTTTIHADWIRGDPGKRQIDFAKLEELGVTHPEQTYFVPVFDKIWLGERMENQDGWVEPDNVFTHNNYWYHIVGFVGFKINVPSEQETECSSGDIEVEFASVIVGGTQPDLPEEPWGWEEPGACDVQNLTITLHD